MGSGGRRVVSRGGRRRSLAETDRPPPVGAPSGVSSGGFWTGGSGSKSSGGGARRPLHRSSSPTNSARLSVPIHGGGAATTATTASSGTGSRPPGGGSEGGGAGGAAAAASVSRDLSSAASGNSTSLSSVIPGVLQMTDLDVYGRGDDAVFGPGAAAATQYEAAAALEATRRRMSVVGAGEHVDRDAWGRGDSAIFGKGASVIAAHDAAEAYRRAQRRAARRGYIVPTATLIDGRWRRDLRPGRWIGSWPASSTSGVGASAGRVGGGSVAADTSASSAAATSLRAGVSRSSGSFVASAGMRTSLDTGIDDHFIPITAGGAYLDRTDDPRSLSRGITPSSTGSALVFPAADETSVGGVEEPATADLFDSDDMALLASYGRRRGEASSASSSGPLWTAGGRRASGSTEEPSTSELLRDETGLEAAAAVAAREAAAARGEEYNVGTGGISGNGGTAGIASKTSPVVAEGGAYGVRIYLDGGADSDSDSSSGVDTPVVGGGREYSPEVEALLFGDDSENDGDVEESVQGMGDGGSRGATTTGSTLVCTTGSGSGSRRRSSTADENARDMMDNGAPDDSWPLGDGGDIYAGTTGEYEMDGGQHGVTAGEGVTDEWVGDTGGVIGGGPHTGVSDITSPSSRGGTTSETATVAAAAATAAAAAASTTSAVVSSPDDWGSEADDAPSSSARFASASTDLSVPGAGVLADGESDADALRAPEEELDVAEEQEGEWSSLGAVPSAGNNDAGDGAADPNSGSASSLGDGPVTGVWPAADIATRDASSPPLEAATGTGEGSTPPSLAAAAGTDPPTAPLAAVAPEPLLESPHREGWAASGEATGDKSTSPHTGPSLSAVMPVANADGLGELADSSSVAPLTEQPPAISPVPVDGKADDICMEPPSMRLRAAAATVDSKTTAEVAAVGSGLAAMASTATGMGMESKDEADAEEDAEASPGDGSSGDGEAGDASSRLTSSRLASTAATMGDTASAGATATGSVLAAVAGVKTGRGGELTAQADAEEDPKANTEEDPEANTEANTEADVEADVEPSAGDDVPAVVPVGDSPIQTTPTRLAASPGTVESKDTAGMAAAGSSLAAVAGIATGRAGEPTVEADAEARPGNVAPADDAAAEPIAQTDPQPAGVHLPADPAAGPAAVDSTATPAVDGATGSIPAPATSAAAGASTAPVAAPAAAAPLVAEIPAVTRSSSVPAPANTVAVDGVASGAGPMSANDGGDKTVGSPADVIKPVPAAAALPANEDALVDAPSEGTAAELPANEDVLADMPSEETDEDYGPTGADVASDDDFTADGPSTGSWAGATAPVGAMAPASTIPMTGMAAGVGGASTAAAAAAAAAIAAADAASATEPDEADEYTTAIDGWEDSLVLTREGGGSRGVRSVHFGRAPSSNATSATDDDARYYDARPELP